MDDVDLKTAAEEPAAEDTNSNGASADSPAAEQQPAAEAPGVPQEPVETEEQPVAETPAVSEEPGAAEDQPDAQEPVAAEERAAIEQQAEAAEEQVSAEAQASEEALAAPEEQPAEPQPEPAPEIDEVRLKAVIEAIVYVAEESATAAQLANALQAPAAIVQRLLDELVADYGAAAHGVMIREVAGGYKMATKAEHHEAVRAFAKSLKPPLKLSLAALETLATIAYKQPITAPEIMEIRGVQGAGVLKTLLDRKLIQAGGRKNVIGRPILYRTSKEFLVHFGLKDLSELPTLKEFEELRRLAIGEDEAPAEPAAEANPDAAAEAPPAASEQPARAPAEVAATESGEPAEVAATESGEPAAETVAPEPAPTAEAEAGEPTAETIGSEPAEIPEPESGEPQSKSAAVTAETVEQPPQSAEEASEVPEPPAIGKDA